MRREFHVSLPYFRIAFQRDEYLVDAFFMNSLKVPARRALLIFPAKDLAQCSHGDVVNPRYGSEKAYELLMESLRWSDERRAEAISKSFKKYRFSFLISLLMPFKWLQPSEQESGVPASELVWASSILRKVLMDGKKVKPCRSLGVVRKCVEGRVEGNEVVFLSGFRDAVRNYSWLVRIDEGFRKAFIQTVTGS